MTDTPPPVQTTSAPVAPNGGNQTNGLAIASLVLGILGILGACGYGFGIVAAIAGLITGYMAKKKPGQQELAKWGRILSWIGVALSVIAIILIILVTVGMIASGASGAAGAGSGAGGLPTP